MASVVETQRLISVSLGKIARSRSQRGGINLHKNLLVASVLNKARTAFMMENYNYQLSQQQKQQQQHQQQQVIPESTTTPVPVSPQSPMTDQGNSLPTHVAQTCPATPGVESRSTPIDPATAQIPSDHVSGVESSSCVLTSQTSTVSSTGSDSDLHCDKENIHPSSDSTTCQFSSEQQHIIPEVKQQCVTGEQHIEAANQLSQDAQSAAQENENDTPSYITLTPCKQQSSASTTCAGVLKRRRVNPEAVQTSHETECPANKKARVSSSSPSSSSDCYSSYSQIPSSCCEYESGASCESETDMQTSDSPQISNLVSIFNSGFSGLCNVSSSSSSSSSEYDNGSYQSDNLNQSSMSHSHHQTWSSSESQSLHCSSMVERIGSISSAIVLSA